MRTTIRLESHLFKQLKQMAAETQRTFTSIIEDAVREVLSRREKKASRQKVHLPVFGGQGLQPGVDLDHSSALLDRMDGR